MGDVVSSHLDEAKREIVADRTGKVMEEFGRLYEQQYAVALFNKVRFDIEGGAGPQSQLLQRKIPLENKSIFSGSIYQNLEENKKWRSRFLFVPDSYVISCYDSKTAYEKRLHPKGTIDCAGYKVLSSLDQYLELISNSLPGVKAKVGSSPFLKFPSQFPVILWHPYAQHYYFCLETEKEQQKWHAVLQDCVRHCNDGLSEEHKVQTPAFTDAVRLYRQAQGHFGTWEMMCGAPSQILSNLVMEGLLPELRELISPRLKGKLHERQRNWMLITDAVYSIVQKQCQAQYDALLHKCEASRSSQESSIRTDMDQIITSKEHVTNKIKEVVLPKAEKLLKVSIQPYISSILEALMEPTSRGFFEVRDIFFRELVDMSKNTLNNGTKETVATHMDRISMLAFHPVKMQNCYEKVEQLSMEGLQQRFDVSSPSVFVQRAQILMRKQMDDAVYTFEQILNQSLESQGSEDLCKTIQRCQDRVIKKFDYDSSTVRKRFFREALLQIFIPYMLKQLGPSCSSELPRFKELIFEDFSRFILVENIFEEVVLHSVMKDIMMAVKEAAVQRRHNLYRDSIVLSNSDPNLHLLGENPSIDWAEKYRGDQEATEAPGEAAEVDGGHAEAQKRRRVKQVVSMIQVEGSSVLPSESPGIDVILEEAETTGEKPEAEASSEPAGTAEPEALKDAPCGSVTDEQEPRPEEGPKDVDSAKEEEEKQEGASDQKENKQSVAEEKPIIQTSGEDRADSSSDSVLKKDEAKAEEAPQDVDSPKEKNVEEEKVETELLEAGKTPSTEISGEDRADSSSDSVLKQDEAKAEEAPQDVDSPKEKNVEEEKVETELLEAEETPSPETSGDRTASSSDSVPKEEAKPEDEADCARVGTEEERQEVGRSVAEEGGCEQPSQASEPLNIPNGSVLPREEAEPEPRCGAEAATAAAPGAEEAAQEHKPEAGEAAEASTQEEEDKENVQPDQEKEPPSIQQEESEKAPPSGGATEGPDPPHNDSGFQSPTCEEVEKAADAACEH